ncbi:MAG: ATP-binding protein [Phycisphaerales bacterium]|nr:ATP-binding protein [Phycisphaerales bacterium]
MSETPHTPDSPAASPAPHPAAPPTPPPVTQRERSAILGSLAAGVVPSIGLHHIQVGRKDEINALLGDVQRIEQDAAAVRVVVGQYGSGKTFFLNLLRAVALERRLVVAQADITTERRLQGTTGYARALYAELMRNLATRARPDGGGLANLVERWIGDLAYEITAAGGTDEDVAKQAHDRLAPLQDLVAGYDFAHVVTQYYKGHAAHDQAMCENAIRWLRAEYSTKTEAREDLGVRTIIDDASMYDYLKLMAAFARVAGYRGLLVLVDELAVLSHRLNNKTARDRNYEAILRIVNDCLQGSVQGLGFVFAATDECLEDKRRGLYSYPALAQRLQRNRFATDDLVDLGGPVVTLKSLTEEECFVMLTNIRRVHAGGRPPAEVLPDEAIVAYLQDCNRRMGAKSFQTPRETVRDFVGLLSILEQNPGADWRRILGTITTSQAAPDPATAGPGVDEEDAPFEADAGGDGGVQQGGGVQGGAATPAPPPSGPAGDDDLASFKL